MQAYVWDAHGQHAQVPTFREHWVWGASSERDGRRRAELRTTKFNKCHIDRGRLSRQSSFSLSSRHHLLTSIGPHHARHHALPCLPPCLSLPWASSSSLVNPVPLSPNRESNHWYGHERISLCVVLPTFLSWSRRCRHTRAPLRRVVRPRHARHHPGRVLCQPTEHTKRAQERHYLPPPYPALQHVHPHLRVPCSPSLVDPDDAHMRSVHRVHRTRIPVGLVVTGACHPRAGPTKKNDGWVAVVPCLPYAPSPCYPQNIGQCSNCCRSAAGVSRKG